MEAQARLSIRGRGVPEDITLKGFCLTDTLPLVQNHYSPQPLRYPVLDARVNRMQQSAFTLAEVLITLGIVGIVAAITMPILINNIQDRIKSEQIRTAKYKFTKATDKMNSLGLIGPYDNTAAFVNELKNHLKIVQICDSNHLDTCWPTKEIMLDDVGTMYEISKTKTGKSFKMPVDDDNDYTSSSVGIVTADGVSMILNYNKKCKSLEETTQYAWTTEGNKPVSNATAGCVAAVIEINGKKKPNKLKDDVVLFNAHGLGLACGIEIGSTCYSVPIASYAPMTRSECDEAVAEGKLGIKGCATHYWGADYWAGAVRACGGVNNMPTMADLNKLASAIYVGHPNITNEDEGQTYVMDRNIVKNMGLPLDEYGFTIWSNEEFSTYGELASSRNYHPEFTSTMGMTYRSNGGFYVLCKSD